MRILFITQYYFPETGATSNRIYALAKYLKEECGHDVTIISEKPNHPIGKFFEGYKKGWFNRSEHEGIPVLHTWVYTKPEKGFLTRILFYVSFMITAVLGAFKLKGKYDAVVATSPPLFVGVSGWMISKIKRAKFVFDVRDLWPGVAVAMGELNNPKAIKVAEAIERFLYKKADLITTVTESFKKDIKRINGEASRVEVVMNGALTHHFDQNRKVSSFRQNHLDSNSFTITYAGNIGLAQGLEHIVEAAEHLSQNNGNARFLILGEGPKKETLQKTAEEKGLSNIHFEGRVPLGEAVKYLMASHALLVPLAQDDIYKMFIPSKLFDSMAAGKPVLLSVDGEARTILEKSKAGLYYEAENAKQLAESVEYLQANPEESRRMGENGYKAAREYYSRDQQSKRMEELLESLVE